MGEPKGPASAGASYRAAGVDIDAADRVKARIAERVRSTHGPSVLRGIGHFGGFFRAPISSGTSVLVSSADSVGTKVLVASLARSYRGLGVDLVNHCVDDILACGALPLFFLDYYAAPVLDTAALEAIVDGLADACAEANCALIGGETAQLPGIYQAETCDLAGFIVGVVQEDEIVDGSKIQVGDRLVGLSSAGLHTNGYSLARSAFGLDAHDGQARRKLQERPQWAGGATLGDVLLEPHRSYLHVVQPLLGTGVLRGMAHITGGGLAGNVERIVPDDLEAVIDIAAWSPPPVFGAIQDAGAIDTDEMYRVFNMGIGFVLVVSQRDVGTVCSRIDGAVEIGYIRPTTGTRASLIGRASGGVRT